MTAACWERGPPKLAWVADADRQVARTSFTILSAHFLRSAMNRFKLMSGGVAAGLLLVVASAGAQSLASPPAGQWWSTWRTYDLQRYSPLGQITTANVKNLKAAWTFSTGTLRGHEGNPLVINNVMYVHSSFPNIVFALDLAEPGALRMWKHVTAQPAEAIPTACCDLVNRGLAYHASGKLFIELLAGDLLALDAKTGKQLWRVPNADYKQGSTMTNAPIVIKDLVIAGISGGEFGVRGRVTAYDVNTGKEVWRGYSTGPDAEVKIVGDANPNYASHRGKDLGVTTWQGDEWTRGGGTTWGWYSYDPELNLFYYSSGNPGSWNPDQRPGDNKWSMTIWARNPETGKVKWAYQMTPHDEWDYDGVNENVLVDLTIGGKPTKALVHFDRNGFGYTVDRTNGKVLVAKPFGPELGLEHRSDDGRAGAQSAVRHHLEEEHRGDLSRRDRLQGSAAVGVLTADQTLLRSREQHLHGLRGRGSEVLRRSAVRRRDRAHVPRPGR